MLFNLIANVHVVVICIIYWHFGKYRGPRL